MVALCVAATLLHTLQSRHWIVAPMSVSDRLYLTADWPVCTHFHYLLLHTTGST
jgi:hypothetical protein